MRKRYIFLLAVGWLILFCGWTDPGWAGPPLKLVIATFQGTPIIEIPVRQGETFSIHYIHSVDISPVYEVFSVDAKRGIVLQQSCMRMFGAGFDPWQAHGKIVEEGGWEKMVNLNVPLGRFLLRVGAPTVEHTLKIRGMNIYLSRMVPEKRVWIMISGAGKPENSKGKK